MDENKLKASLKTIDKWEWNAQTTIHDDVPILLPAIEEKEGRAWSRTMIVASTIVLIGAGLWFYSSTKNPAFTGKSLFTKHADFPPGRYQATLTLANGKTIPLQNDNSGVVVDASELSYYDGSNVDVTDHLSRSGTITTPRGGQYRITLPDGTNVWLNSASSLSFSLVPGKKQTRIVTLSGEAYFEVAKDSHRLFIVKTASQEVEVLGTHFNISSYAEEGATKTTLISGSLRVVNRSSKIEGMLKRGQQSIVVKDILTVAPVDVKNVMSWKEGYFQFSEHQDFSETMAKVARWYNVKIKYEGDMRDVSFTGKVSRFQNLSFLLEKIASEGQLKFQVDKDLITVIRQ